MYLQTPDLEQRLSRLQAQLDRLSLALHQRQRTQESLEPMELRLSQLIQQSGEILDRLAATEERHALAVGEVESRLTDWKATETRLQDEAYERIREFERTVEQEWSALRQQLSHDLQAAVAEMRGGVELRPRSQVSSEPPGLLEDVARPADEPHDAAEGLDAPRAAPVEGRDEAAAARPSQAVSQIVQADAALASRIESLERAVTSGQEELTQAIDRSEHHRRRWYVALVLLALVGVGGAGAVALGLQRRVDAKLNEAGARVTAAEQQAEVAQQQAASTRENAERQITEARQTAQQAQIVSAVLAAPDLVRYVLISDAATRRPYGQLLWSRSRGFVFGASRMPAVPAEQTYQLWLLTRTEPVSAGLFVPDSAGRVSLTTDEPPRVPRPVIGASVTIEQSGGAPAPSDPPILTRPPDTGVK